MPYWPLLMTQKKKLGNWHNRFSQAHERRYTTRGHLASPSLSQKFTYFCFPEFALVSCVHHDYWSFFRHCSFVLAFVSLFKKNIPLVITLFFFWRNSSFLEGGSLQSLIFIYIHIWYGQRVFDLFYADSSHFFYNHGKRMMLLHSQAYVKGIPQCTWPERSIKTSV